ncbi:MAG TPA: glycosyltransferase [Gaiellaceae bacterium]|nr:glycosyltransferase [Gaiellaceae bacterium]
MRIKPVDLELRGGVVPFVSRRYDGARLLVRDGGVPVGSVQSGVPGELDLRSLRTSAVAAAEWQLWHRSIVERLTDDTEERDEPAISVVVCTRDRSDALDGCLRALALQEYREYEVIVVDNASRDERTREVAEAHRARYVQERRPGLDWARNRGVDAALFDIVAFTDDDARPDSRWLAAVGRGFASSGVHAVTGLVAPAELETTAQWLFEDVYGGMGKGYRSRLHCRRGMRSTFTPNIYGTGCNMAFRRSALRALGGFDPALDAGTLAGGGGDLDMFQRVIESGGALLYLPDAVVRHVHRRTPDGLRRQLFDNGRAYSAVLWKCLRRAHGRDRLRVLRSYGRWFYWWHLRRTIRRACGVEEMPIEMIRAEFIGGVIGPALYAVARRRARRLGDGVIA